MLGDFHPSVLGIAWIAVALVTVVFVAVAAVTILPRMGKLKTLTVTIIVLAASGITAIGGTARPARSRAAYLGTANDPIGSGTMKVKEVSAPGQPLRYNAAPAGHVVFTFDDGPDAYTPSVVRELELLNIRGVFFTIGMKVSQRPQMVRLEDAHGDLVENHTWDHKSMTGKGTGTKPLTADQVRTELMQSSEAIVAAGLPAPKFYRPPYGAIDSADNNIGSHLGMRLVMDSSNNGTIIDSNDWAGITTQQIADRVDNQISKMLWRQPPGSTLIVAFHDGIKTAPNMIRALPIIVQWMNHHNVNATTHIPVDATGGTIGKG